MHAFNLLLTGIMFLSAIILIVCAINDENMTPVAKLFSSLFYGLTAALVLSLMLAANPAKVVYQELSLAKPAPPCPAVQQFERNEGISDQQFRQSELGRQVVAAPVVMTPPVQVVAAPVAAPAADSGMKDALLGGALGYALGSAGNRSGGDTHVTHVTNTTVVHQAAPAVAPRPYVAAAPVPAPRPTFTSSAPSRSSYSAPVSSSSSWKSTFSMTRSRR